MVPAVLPRCMFPTAERTTWMLTVFILVSLLATGMPTTADHSHEEEGRAVTFDHRGGNEWWVEVDLGGRDAASVARVEAQDTDGAWVALTFRSWGVWGDSFHVEPGHEVRFRALWPDGQVITSCWFGHPDGEERCAADAAPAVEFDAVFSGAKGNDWWVEVFVSGNEPLVDVEARLDCQGDWRPLTKRSWGAWAQSFFVTPGSVVDFRARSTSGAVDLSAGHVWPAATPTDPCPPDVPPAPPEDLLVTFDGVAGNDWWVQVFVDANEALSGVEARVGCTGEWRPLTLRSWGGWASSFFIPRGSTVDLRALGASGAETLSGAYVWPEATPTAPCRADAPAAPFENVRGNQWWIETDIVTDRTVTQVEVRINGGDWLALQKTDWGSWARSQRTSDPARVEFRATMDDGTHVTSPEGWLWGPAPVFHPPLDERTTVAFEELGGDLRNIKVNTFSEHPLLGVSYRVGGGSPQVMERDADGDWIATRPTAMPDGSRVTFLAFYRDPATGGTVTVASEAFEWPPWPQPDAWAEYVFRHGEEAGDARTISEGTFRTTFTAGGAAAASYGTWIGTWEGTCTAQRSTYDAARDAWTVTEETQRRLLPAPVGPAATAVGEVVDVRAGERCGETLLDVVVEERFAYESAIRPASGTPLVLDAWRGSEAQADVDAEVLWHRDTGLVANWHIVVPRPDGGIRNGGELIAASVFEER